MKITLTFLGLIMSSLLFSQSFFSVQNYGSLAQPNKAGQLGSFNPWFGSSIGYSIVGEGNLSNSFFASGQFQVPLDFLSKSEQFKVPLVTNIGAFKSKINFEDSAEIAGAITDLASGNTGVILGLHPAIDLTGKSYSSAYAQIEGKWNRFTDEMTSENSDIIQLRLGIGYEFGLMNSESGDWSNLILSINPVYSFYSTGDLESLFEEDNMSNLSVELTGIYRLAEGIALVAEYIVGEDLESPFNAGVIFAFEAKKK